MLVIDTMGRNVAVTPCVKDDIAPRMLDEIAVDGKPHPPALGGRQPGSLEDRAMVTSKGQVRGDMDIAGV